MANSFTFIEDQQVQTGLRLDEHVLKTLKSLSQSLDCSTGELLQSILENVFIGKPPLSAEELNIAQNLYQMYLPQQAFDTIIVPAKITNFNTMFMSKGLWDCVYIAPWRIPHLKFISVYNTRPYSQIQWWAKIKTIQLAPNSKKSIIYLDGSPQMLSTPIQIATPKDSIRRSRYTSLALLQKIQNTSQL